MAGKNERGFAAMDPEQQREIARRGGRAAHESGNAHEFTSEEAAEAGRKGGEAVSRNREHMAEIGRKGGLAAHHRNAAFHHESAAHHHRKAAQHHDAGELEEGERHGVEAHNQSETAHGHSQKSRRSGSVKAGDPLETANKSGQPSQQKADATTTVETSDQDHGLEADLSTSDVEQQENLSRGDSDEVRTSGNEDDDTETGGGRSNRQSGREDLHA
jgi:general stress protein YciG